MNKFNFIYYNKDAEIDGGDYWNFLNATKETILENDICLLEISKVINEITNTDLKFRIKQKLFSLIMENQINLNDINSLEEIFDINELKLLFEHEFNTNIIKYMSNEEETKHYFGDIMCFITNLRKANNNDFEYLMISSILSIIKNYNDKSTLIGIIEHNKDCEETYNKLIDEYYSFFPEEYKNFLKMKQDPSYIQQKTLQFKNENIDIGIDPRISIAPEIEANNDYPIQIELHNQIGFEEYLVTSEATVPNGDEIKPRHPFHNRKEDMVKFCSLCETMRDIGYYYSEESQNAAGQINLGLDYLDTKEAILNFYEIYGNCEELLYYICNGENQLFRQNIYCNSRIKAISQIIGTHILTGELSRQDVIELFNNKACGKDQAIEGLKYKKNSVCLRGTTDQDYRLEFRIPNGGCNYKIWIDNIRLFGKILEISKKLADIMNKDYLSSEEENLLRLKIDLQDNNLSLEEKLVLLMNLLFKEDNIKQIYYNRYLNTIKKIKETGSTHYKNINYSTEPSFDEVEFIEEYHSMLNPDYDNSGLVVTYDPENNIIHSNK